VHPAPAPVANDAQNGHSKSEYSVISIAAESDPSV